MNRNIVWIVLSALILVATGCKKNDQPAGEPASAGISLVITGAPESAVLVGETFALNVEITPEDANVGTVVWSSSDPAVAKVNADGYVLATGKGECEISATAEKASAKVSVSVKDRDPAKDEMGHQGAEKKIPGQNNNSTIFSIGNTGWTGFLWYQGGNNSMTYYGNGTFKAAWNGTNNFIAGVGYYGGDDKRLKNMQYDCYFRHSKTGSGGGYNYISVYGWTLNPLVEFYIVEDWFSKPGSNLLGQKKGEFVVDGDTYTIYENKRFNAPSVLGDTQTFPQYFSVRSIARRSGHIDVSAHFRKWDSLGMKMGVDMRQLMYYIEVGGGSGSLDCDYLYLSDGKI